MRAGIVAGAVIVAALAGCGSGGSSATAGQAAAVTASPSSSLTPLQECTTVVTKLLEQTQEAVKQGYSGGINMQSVMEQYGVESAIWQTFSELDSQELADFAENGVGTGDPAEVLQVPQTCEEHLPSGSGGQG